MISSTAHCSVTPDLAARCTAMQGKVFIRQFSSRLRIAALRATTPALTPQGAAPQGSFVHFPSLRAAELRPAQRVVAALHTTEQGKVQ